MNDKLDRFSQLVDDIAENRLSLNQVQIAIRTAVRQCKDLPDGIKDILCGSGPASAGLIYKMFSPIREVIGALELAYRRGTDFRKEKS